MLAPRPSKMCNLIWHSRMKLRSANPIQKKINNKNKKTNIKLEGMWHFKFPQAHSNPSWYILSLFVLKFAPLRRSHRRTHYVRKQSLTFSSFSSSSFLSVFLCLHYEERAGIRTSPPAIGDHSQELCSFWPKRKGGHGCWRRRLPSQRQRWHKLTQRLFQVRWQFPNYAQERNSIHWK